MSNEARGEETTMATSAASIHLNLIKERNEQEKDEEDFMNRAYAVVVSVRDGMIKKLPATQRKYEFISENAGAFKGREVGIVKEYLNQVDEYRFGLFVLVDDHEWAEFKFGEEVIDIKLSADYNSDLQTAAIRQGDEDGSLYKNYLQNARLELVELLEEANILLSESYS